MGRPKIEIDYEQLKALSSIQCTVEEICSILDIHKDTFYDRLKTDSKFSDAYKKGINTGKASLRRQQWSAAKKGNPSMLIWLGKQYLGQSDSPFNDTEDELEFT